jgi:chorismate mutase
MPTAVRALRGATTFDVDETDHVSERVVDLMETLIERNGVDHEDIISIVFTATEDLTCMFPATAARSVGLGDVPLICARELAIAGSTAQCIRVLMHLNTDRARAELRHVYLEGARGLRDDLPE